MNWWGWGDTNRDSDTVFSPETAVKMNEPHPHASTSIPKHNTGQNKGKLIACGIMPSIKRQIKPQLNGKTKTTKDEKPNRTHGTTVI